MTVSEENDEFRRMLRKVCRVATPLPNDVQDWWTAEQARMATEATQADSRKTARAAEITAKIADLQQQLARLS